MTCNRRNNLVHSDEIMLEKDFDLIFHSGAMKHQFMVPPQPQVVRRCGDLRNDICFVLKTCERRMQNRVPAIITVHVGSSDGCVDISSGNVGPTIFPISGLFGCGLLRGGRSCSDRRGCCLLIQCHSLGSGQELEWRWRWAGATLPLSLEILVFQHGCIPVLASTRQ